MLIYYIVMAILGAINLIIYISRQDKRSNTNITVVFYLCFISNLGYLALATSNTLETALLANKICYLGGCFLLPHVLFAILQLCNYSISKRARFCLYAVSAAMYSCVLSAGYLNIYYKKVSLAHADNVSYLMKEYAFGHTLFYIALCVYIFIVL